MGQRILCDQPELAVECLAAASRVGLDAETEISPKWDEHARAALEAGEPIALGISETPSLEQLVGLSHAAARTGATVVVAGLGREDAARQRRDAAADLGLVCVSDVGALIAVLQLHNAGAERSWTASTRRLPSVDRTRLGEMAPARPDGGLLERGDDALLTWRPTPGTAPTTLGMARDVAEAIIALQAAHDPPSRIASSVEGVDEQAVLDVLFGPRRALSDPASKAALSPYGVPLPIEELCSSPTRAAAEATRIGYPVRIALASPDLRVWEHPELEVDPVDSAAGVRDTFRQLMGLGRGKLEVNAEGTDDRLLGVMVSTTAPAVALLWVRMWPLPQGRVGASLGFADPHGHASGDATMVVLPTPVGGVERALARLRGHNLVLSGSGAQRRERVASIADVLLRLSAFVNDQRERVEHVEVRPLALVLDGSVEVRGACVVVSEAFERSLELPPELMAGP